MTQHEPVPLCFSTKRMRPLQAVVVQAYGSQLPLVGLAFRDCLQQANPRALVTV